MSLEEQVKTENERLINLFHDYLMTLCEGHRMSVDLKIYVLDCIQVILPELDTNDWRIDFENQTLNLKYIGKSKVLEMIKEVAPIIEEAIKMNKENRKRESELAITRERERIYEEWFNNKAFVIPRLSLVE